MRVGRVCRRGRAGADRPRPGRDATAHETILAANLRAALLRYPADALLAALVDELPSRSRRFDTLWRAPRPVAAYESSATFTQSDGDSLTLRRAKASPSSARPALSGRRGTARSFSTAASSA
ncbi:MmyB family transcriptional regulator [Isoptericola croceus]|uniref:MmyB family transcriptional regulator n=1 Tax=Isoptericola croceus TaxID=3031406 RepID=UPI0034D410A6